MRFDPGLERVLGGARIVGRYAFLDPCVIYDKLGHGGMGTVFLAHHLNLGLDVAVKCLDAPLVANRAAVERMKREAQIAGRIHHENLVNVFDVKESGGIHYIVMRYVAGVNAAEMVAARGALKREAALEVVYRASLGLEAGHRRGIVHRDVKPENLLIGSDDEVAVADLGLARRIDAKDTLTAEGFISGTPAYMAPEQWDLEAVVGPPADVHALGSTLFFLLAGKNLNPGSDLQGRRRWTCADAPEDVAALAPGLPDDCVAIINRALRRDPGERFPDAGALARVLEPICARNAIRFGVRPRPTADAPTAAELAKLRNRAIASGDSSVTRRPAEKTVVTRTTSIRVRCDTGSSVTIAVPSGADGRELNRQIESAGMNEQQRREYTYAPLPGLRLVLIPEATFRMGHDGGSPDESPEHDVSLSPYLIGKFPVTNEQYLHYCESTGAARPDDPRYDGVDDYMTEFPRHPVVNVSWTDAQNFCRHVGGDLPTEAQWEYAARGSDGRSYPWGDVSPTRRLAHVRDAAHAGKPLAVDACRGASPHGVRALAGNVWEWCLDRYEPYSKEAAKDPQGPAEGDHRVYRGGSFDFSGDCARSTYRSFHWPEMRAPNLGFRVALLVKSYSREPLANAEGAS